MRFSPDPVRRRLLVVASVIRTSGFVEYGIGKMVATTMSFYISRASSASITWERTASRRRPPFSSHLLTTVIPNYDPLTSKRRTRGGPQLGRRSPTQISCVLTSALVSYILSGACVGTLLVLPPVPYRLSVLARHPKTRCHRRTGLVVR